MAWSGNVDVEEITAIERNRFDRTSEVEGLGMTTTVADPHRVEAEPVSRDLLRGAAISSKRVRASNSRPTANAILDGRRILNISSEEKSSNSEAVWDGRESENGCMNAAFIKKHPHRESATGLIAHPEA